MNRRESSLKCMHSELVTSVRAQHICGDALIDADSGSAFERDQTENSSYFTESWECLPKELLELVLHLAGNDAQTLQSLAQVCQAWRYALFCESSIIRSVEFHGLRVHSTNAPQRTPFPTLLRRALMACNQTACIVAARFLMLHSQEVEAHRYWRIAARKGHPEAQAHLGCAHYFGLLPGVDRDPEEAYLQLTRSCKALSEVLKTKDTLPEKTSLPVLMTEADCIRILRHISHILAIVILDGEAISPLEQNNSAAIKWLTVSNTYGCSEAAKLLQSMFRSGQY